jgi:hypothetical protein
MLDALIIQQCAPMIDLHLMQSVISARLLRQPQNLAEAKATAQYLEQAGYNYSLGVVQVNRSNFNRFKLSLDNVFDTCTNLNAGGQILAECLNRALAQGYQQQATHKALSCYYAGQLNSRVGAQYANKVLAKLTLISSTTEIISKPSNSNEHKRTGTDYLLTRKIEAKPQTEPVGAASAVVF